jgi:hypothetical protein
MKLYIFFRWCPFLYKIIYDFLEVYHEKKIIYRIVSKVVKWWDKSFLFGPAVFIAHQCYPNIKMFEAIVGLPVVDLFHQYYLFSPEIFSILAVILFLCSEIFANNLKSIENEKRVAISFHFVNHKYRDFIDDILVFKKQKKIYSDTLTNGQSELVHSKYSTIIFDMCRKAQREMAKIINDPKCYISIKWLDVSDNSDEFILNHDDSFPTEEPRNHVNQIKLLRSSHGSPKTLFQAIMDKFDSAKNGGTDTWDWGLRSNDVKGCQSFDCKLPGFNRNIKSTIVLPITISASLTGFFCFNSFKLGRLRKKHQHFLAGYCDIIANLYRSMLEYSIFSTDDEKRLKSIK